MGAAGLVITKSAGHKACEDDSVLLVDANLRIYSFAKIITTVSALQCIERGQIHLDDDVDYHSSRTEAASRGRFWWPRWKRLFT